MKLMIDHNTYLSRSQITQDMINATQGLCSALLDLEIIDANTYIRNESWHLIRQWMRARDLL